MAIHFRKEEERFTFHDPMQGGKLVDRATEIRYDPLTGETSRILFDSGAPFVAPDYTELAAKGWCPFCNDNVMSSTPAFPDEVVDGGRMVKGEAVAFPNLFPYGKHNAVVRMTEQHYVRLEEFSAEIIHNAFFTAHEYLKKAIASDPNVTHLSVNWNYLPPSGGSILHPHIQTLASEHPTRYQAVKEAAGERFLAEHGVNYYPALVEEERRLGDRWIGRKGSLSWVHAFAPRSHMDFVGVFEQCPSFAELDAAQWLSLAESMLSFFPYLASKGLAGFNLALFIPVRRSPPSWTHVRLVPRLTYGVLNTSDMHVFNFLHGESLSLKVPEQIAKEAAEYFS